MPELSHAELCHLVEDAVAHICGLPRIGLRFTVQEVKFIGVPTNKLLICAALHFLRDGSPFCCGQAGCHLGLMGEKLDALAAHISRDWMEGRTVEVEFCPPIATVIHGGATFGLSKVPDWEGAEQR